MKFIVQNIEGSVYAYFESDKHHESIEPQRGGKRLCHSNLSHECDMAFYPNSYFVIDVAMPKAITPKKPKKKATKKK